jgi:hypothetical protein
VYTIYKGATPPLQLSVLRHLGEFPDYPTGVSLKSHTALYFFNCSTYALFHQWLMANIHLSIWLGQAVANLMFVFVISSLLPISSFQFSLSLPVSCCLVIFNCFYSRFLLIGQPNTTRLVQRVYYDVLLMSSNHVVVYNIQVALIAFNSYFVFNTQVGIPLGKVEICLFTCLLE